MWEYNRYNPAPDELYHWKYIKRYKAPDGSWRYVYGDEETHRSITYANEAAKQAEDRLRSHAKDQAAYENKAQAAKDKGDSDWHESYRSLAEDKSKVMRQELDRVDEARKKENDLIKNNSVSSLLSRQTEKIKNDVTKFFNNLGGTSKKKDVESSPKRPDGDFQMLGVQNKNLDAVMARKQQAREEMEKKRKQKELKDALNRIRNAK